MVLTCQRLSTSRSHVSLKYTAHEQTETAQMRLSYKEKHRLDINRYLKITRKQRSHKVVIVSIDSCELNNTWSRVEMSPLTQPCPQRDVEYTQENKNTVVSLILFDDCPKVDCFVSPTSVRHPSYFFLVLDLNEGRSGAWPQIKNFFVMRHSCDTFCWKRPAFKHERSTQSRQGKKKKGHL